MIHELKTWPQYFEPLWDRRKTFEVRRDDRDFAVGDTLLLMEWCPTNHAFTGRVCRRTVTYILPGGNFGLSSEFVVLGLAE